MIVICSDLERAFELGGPRHVDHATRLDSGAACAHLGLLAPAFGLGVCTITSWAEPVLSEMLQLPQHIRPDVTVAVGYVPPSPPAGARGFKYSAWHNAYGRAIEIGKH
jgi:nitroreductase